ncbi:MAG: GGDEF domain-containing protein [Clostridium sp.]|nr:GGDEF domain-containing protein [Clostridium sp.]
MKKTISLQNVYIIFLCIHIVLLVIAGFSIKENKFNLGEQNSYAEITPIQHDVTSNGEEEIQQYIFSIDNTRMNSYLMFYTNHQEVSVSANGEVIYTRTKADSVFGHTTGAVWNLVEFPSDTSEIIVTIKPIYPSGWGDEHTFYQGNGVAILRELLHNSFFSMFICLILVLSGVCIILYWLVFCQKAQIAKELLYMGILALLIGAWAFLEEQIIMIMFSNRVYASYITYILLMLIGVTFMLFIKYYLVAKERLIHKFMLFLSFGSMPFMMLLQAFHIADFKETVLIVHIVLVCDLITFLFCIVDKTRKRKGKKNVNLNFIGLLVLTASVGFELYAYYTHLGNAQLIGMLGLLTYIIILGLEVGSNAYDKIAEIRKAEIYKELAEKDILTQCFNRNAYNDAVQKHSSEQNIYIVMLDLNNLKKCNDTLGHMEGDRYLTDSAKLIKKIFSNYGRVYRIGGDEFCVIMENTSDEEINGLIRQLREEENLYNEKSKTVFMQIASGYARYNPKEDSDLDQTRCRADILMYENKKALKAGKV